MSIAWRESASIDHAKSHGLKNGEWEAILKALGRKPSILELGILSAVFSEHCSYKSSKVHLKTLPTKGKHVLQGPGENAGIIDIGDGEAVVFKVESHNHPSFIEPFQGAATGVGGILRDIFTMGARPLALLNSLRFGDLDVPRTRYLLRRAVNGIGFYGNCMGIPTIGGEVWFHPSYNGNCLVNAFALGVVRHEDIFRASASGEGNPLVYVGSKTGRDGIHGATMSSEAFGDDADSKRPTVQVGDPFQEKLLLEACLEAMKTGAVVGIQDMGAAGLTSSTYEMAERGETGIRLHLDRVPQRETGMTPYELMLSESQERMLLVADKKRVDEVLKVFEHWELDAAIVGEVIPGNSVELYWNGECVSTMSVPTMMEALPEYRWPTAVPSNFAKINPEKITLPAEPSNLDHEWLRLLTSPNSCSRRAVYSQYDSTVRTNTVVHPGGDAGVIRLKREDGRPNKGIAITLDCNSRYVAIHPHLGTMHALVEGMRNLAAVGAAPLGISDCLNMPSPERPETMWQIAESIRGLAEAATALEIPIISGNVSLYNETHGVGVYPTPLLALVGLVPDASKCTTLHFKHDGDVVFVIGDTDESEIGGSEYLAVVHSLEVGPLPKVNLEQERLTCETVRSLIQQGLLASCHDLSAGGLGIGLAECCFGEDATVRGVTLRPAETVSRKDGYLFSESGARFVLSCSAGNAARVQREIEQAGLPISAQGVIGGESIQIEGVAKIRSSEAYEGWSTGLDRYIEG